MTRLSPADAAHIVVHFPPQHISEEAFDENFGPPAFTERIRSFISGDSRLAFRVPDETASIPFTIESLLDWNAFEPATHDVEDEESEPLPPQVPAEIQTAIEMPYRLVLAPKDGQWEHRTQPGVPAGHSVNAELWHTSYTPDPTSVFSPHFRLKAIWTPDIDSGDDANPFPMSLTPDDRVEIVHLSSDDTLLAESNFNNLSGDELLLLEELRHARSSLLLGTELRLGAFGGSMNVHSRFHFPQPLPASIYTRALGFFDVFDTDGIFFSLENWSHHISMGRDQHVKTVRRGFLYPFGHAASLVTISERKFTQAQTGQRAAYLMQRVILIVQQPERRYADDHRAFPFKSIALTDSVVHTDVPASPIFMAKVQGAPYRFPVVALDRDDREVHFATPLVFVPADRATDTAAIQGEYDNHETVTLPSQMISFAPDPQRRLTRDRAPDPSRTTLRTVAMTFGVKPESLGSLPLPIMESAAVAVPAAEKMLGAAAPTVTIALNESYLANGFTEAAGNAFADIQGGMKLAMAAEKAGGVAAPNLEMTALSLTRGAFPDVKELVGGGMSPEEVVKQLFKGKLLGVVDLPTLIDFGDDEENLPKITPDESGRHVTFVWKPKLNNTLAGPDGVLQPENGVPTLELNGTISPDAVEVNGILSNVALSFLEMLRVGFSALTFKMATGRDPKFGANVSSFGFAGDLSFVDKLTKALPMEGLGDDGPSVKITPEGASAGLTLSIPTIPLGPLFLMNLSLSAMLNLYFFGKPATVSFSLSSRKDPFLITYTVFGGGGHFTFTAGTDGEIEIDAALQFGGAAEIDIGVAKGVIQAMVGIALEMKDGSCKLTGFVRIYGCVEILEIITISVEFYLALSYQAPDAIGEASLTVMVSVLGLSKSVTLRVEKRFSTQDTLERDSRNAIGNAAVAAVSVDDWTEYCLAFAGNG